MFYLNHNKKNSSSKAVARSFHPSASVLPGLIGATVLATGLLTPGEGSALSSYGIANPLGGSHSLAGAGLYINDESFVINNTGNLTNVNSLLINSPAGAGGVITINANGTLENRASFDNYGGALIYNYSDNFRNTSTGTLRNFGVMHNQSGGEFVNYGVFEQKTYLKINGGLVYNDGTGSFKNEVTTWIYANGRLRNGSNGYFVNDGSVLGYDDSEFVNVGTMVNNDLISTSGLFTNTGTLTNSAAGSIDANLGNFNIFSNYSNGAINNHGSMDLDVYAYNDSGAVLNNFDSGTILNERVFTNNALILNDGTIENQGTFRNREDMIFIADFRTGALTDLGNRQVSGSWNIRHQSDATNEIRIDEGLSWADGDVIKIIDRIGGSLTGSLASVFATDQDGNLFDGGTWAASYSSGDLILTFTEDVPIPEPGTYALLGSSLVLCQIAARRKRQLGSQ